MRHNLTHATLTGILIASVIMMTWVGSLGLLLWIEIAQLNLLFILVAFLGRTYIQTGLFIVAHDAIHGSVAPGDRCLNRWVGQLAVTLYAQLSYQKLCVNHWQHHRYPGQEKDPDFHDGINRNLFLWYWRFMERYMNNRERTIMLFKIIMVFLVASFGLNVSVGNLLLFWLLPIVFSSMQLFFFGTYLPHRSEYSDNAHHAVSSDYSFFWSFLTCYHFGYHWEHHEYPDIPWYNLPSAHQNQ